MEEDKGVSIDSARYVLMQQNFLKPKLQDLGENTTVWFQKDGATNHTAKKSSDVWWGLFPVHLNSLYGDIGWPARSLDLSPCDYFL